MAECFMPVIQGSIKNVSQITQSIQRSYSNTIDVSDCDFVSITLSWNGAGQFGACYCLTKSDNFVITQDPMATAQPASTRYGRFTYSNKVISVYGGDYYTNGTIEVTKVYL